MQRLSLLPNLTAVQMTNAILHSMAEYPTGRKALACSPRAKAIWTRSLPGVVVEPSRENKLAAREVFLCLQNMGRLDIPVTEGTCLGLIEIVDATRGNK